MTPAIRKAVGAGGLIGGAIAVGVAVTWYFIGGGFDRTIKVIPPDETPTPGKTGYKRIDAILGALKAAASAAGIPLGLMVGWIAKESGGKLSDTTSLDERGYFQLMPAESKSLGLDHQRLSTDSDYSIQAGVDIINYYRKSVDALGVASSGSSYYWRLVKLAHSMGAGQMKKVVNAANAAGSADSWSDLESFAEGMKINGPQPKKWFPFVDSVYQIGAPFGFGSESSVGRKFAVMFDDGDGLNLLGAEAA
jgi:Transglycosylase SLT domain